MEMRRDRQLRQPSPAIDARFIDTMTSYDYHMTMIYTKEKSVRVAELKARLSEFLRAVRAGHTVTVCDRDTPIARLVPYHPESVLSVRKPLRPLHDFELPEPLGRPIDSLAALLEERQNDR